MVFIPLIILIGFACAPEKASEQPAQGPKITQEETVAEETTVFEETEGEPAQELERLEEELIQLVRDYAQAIEDEDFEIQKKLTTEAALELTLYKEEEWEYSQFYGYETDLTIEGLDVTIDQVGADTAQGTLTFRQIYEYPDSAPSTISVDRELFLAKKQNEWKISDYTRNDWPLSKTLFYIEDAVVSSHNMILIIDRLFLWTNATLLHVKVDNRDRSDLVWVKRPKNVL